MVLHVAYIAGFLDGDGTIFAMLVPQGKRRLSLRLDVRVSFSNLNLCVLRAIQEFLGCGKLLVALAEDGGSYRLDIQPMHTGRVLGLLREHLIVKKQQAEIALELLATVNKKGGRSVVSSDVHVLREALVQEMKVLNRRDGKDFRKKWVNSVNTSAFVTKLETIPSQAAEGIGSVEGVTTREVSPNNKPLHETPPRKGRDSLTSTVM